MCRIAGLVDFLNPIAESKHRVEQMCYLQKHGGPDDGGIFVSEDCHLVLGNRRLSLLDLGKEGHMPMSYNNQYHITYNGEIYNHLVLKNELISLGHKFSNKTDTEIILAAFSQWGELSFQKLKGMFAFALFDSIEKELYLVRDAAGIKPLYYLMNDSGLGFASEVRALQSSINDDSIEKKWPIYFMAYGHLPEPITTFSAIKPLPKGFFLKYSFASKKYHFQSISHFSYSSQIKDASFAHEEVEKVLSEAVNSHLLADAPIGVFLSGGLDSGIIASIASDTKKQQLNSLSIYFEEEKYSEKKYQDMMIQQLNCNYHQLLLKESDFENSFPEILNSMDLPSCDGINTWFISKHAAEKGLKAVLSGLGGDELFGGYPSFNRLHASYYLQKLPNFIKMAGKRSALKRLSRTSYLRLDGLKGIYLFLRGHFSPYEIAQQLGAYENDIWNCLDELPNIVQIDTSNDKNAASWMEFNLYMQNQLLRDADIMGMKHGVEIRVPFLDDGVVRMANKIENKIKYKGKYPKQFLIDTFHHRLPKEIWDRPKMGFSFPFSQWLAKNNYAKQLMMEGNQMSQKKYQSFMEGKLHWSHLMTLMIMNHRKVI